MVAGWRNCVPSIDTESCDINPAERTQPATEAVWVFDCRPTVSHGCLLYSS